MQFKIIVLIIRRSIIHDLSCNVAKSMARPGTDVHSKIKTARACHTNHFLRVRSTAKSPPTRTTAHCQSPLKLHGRMLYAAMIKHKKRSATSAYVAAPGVFATHQRLPDRETPSP